MGEMTAIRHDAVAIVVEMSASLGLVAQIDTTLLGLLLLLLRLLGLILVVGLIPSGVHHGHPW